MDVITSVMVNETAGKKAKGMRVEKGFLDRLIKEKKKEFGVVSDISKKTIQNRVSRGIVFAHHGAKSPLFEVEAERALVELCIQMGKIRQPLNVTEGIEVMNNLIEGTEVQQDLIAFQKSRKLGKEDFEHGKVTKGWWVGFLKRHEHEIVTKRGEKFALNRAEWTTLPNISQMYDVIYDEFVDAKVAIPCSPYFTDFDGNPTDDDLKKYSRAQNIKITKPGWILMAYESSFSTSQKKVGHVGGQRLIVERGTVPQIIACTTDHKFTLHPFTSASGHAVCCVVIFQGKQGKVPAIWRTGIDHTVTPIFTADGKEIDFELNFGNGKYYPGGPTCRYNNKIVDCLTCVSESGGITGCILVGILTYFDAIQL